MHIWVSVSFWEIQNVFTIISEADHEYYVVKAILLCRICTHPLLKEHNSLVSSVNGDTSL